MEVNPSKLKQNTLPTFVGGKKESRFVSNFILLVFHFVKERMSERPMKFFVSSIFFRLKGIMLSCTRNINKMYMRPYPEKETAKPQTSLMKKKRKKRIRERDPITEQ